MKQVTITAQKGNEKFFPVAQVAILKTINIEHNKERDKHDIERATKLAFYGYLCPAPGCSLQSSINSDLVAAFGVERESVPGIIVKVITFEKTLLNSPSKIAMVRIRFGKFEGEMKADVINANLEKNTYVEDKDRTSNYGWTSDIIYKLLDPIASDLRGKGVTGVGGFDRLYEGLCQDLHPSPQIDFFNILKDKFKDFFPLRGQPFFIIKKGFG